ncbi:MAG: hypothetical protein QOJ69_171 [Actinomycetota bacterium]|nr:hypothetical protein [Actinomycetota bacterium]MEA2842500.1 hypothetical protein [Actinomycetota bacterium]
MVAVATRRSAPVSAAPQAKPSEASTLARWMKVWVGLLCTVTLVVVVALILITNSLSSINGNLGVASRAVAGVQGDTAPLPARVDSINQGLAGIDSTLKPLSAPVTSIITSLTSIDGKLAQTDSSLGETSTVLTSVLNSATAINTTLVDADEPADQLGVQNIHRRIATANNGPLTGIDTDASAITQGLIGVNKSLTGICSGLVVSVVNVVTSLLGAGRGAC